VDREKSCTCLVERKRCFNWNPLWRGSGVVPGRWRGREELILLVERERCFTGTPFGEGVELYLDEGEIERSCTWNSWWIGRGVVCT